jgi:hypothetical protein
MVARLVPARGGECAVRLASSGMAVDGYGELHAGLSSDQSDRGREAHKPLRVLQPDAASHGDLHVGSRP